MQDPNTLVYDLAEASVPTKSRHWTFYLVLFFLVLPVWAVVPLSWLYVLYYSISGTFWSFGWIGRTAFAYALCEVLFSIYYYNLSRRISGPSPIAPNDVLTVRKAFERILHAGLILLPEDHGDDASLVVDGVQKSTEEIIQDIDPNDPRAVDFRNWLRTWFGKVPWSHLRTQEIYAWVHWSAFNTALPASLDELHESRRAILDETMDLIRKCAACPIPDGSNPNVKPLLLTIDPVNVSFRPLVWYLFVKLGNLQLQRHYKAKGLVLRRFRGLEYLIHIPKGYDRRTGTTPCVFLHGLGLGLMQYQRFLAHLLESCPDQPLLVPLQPHISQDIFHSRFLAPMLKSETVEILRELLTELGWVEYNDKDSEGITMLSHSNGSFGHAWMLKTHPELISRSCFVDPVTFCSWEGDVCYNFLYRPCTNGLELLMRYFVGTELGVANLLQRNFDWLHNSLWYDEIPNAHDPQRVMFFLGGQDAIVDAARVKRYLQSHGVKKNLWFDPKGIHGQALIEDSEGIQEMLRWLKDSPSPINGGL